MILLKTALKDKATTIARRLARWTSIWCLVGVAVLAAGCASDKESHPGDAAGASNDASQDSTLVEAQRMGTIPVDMLKAQAPEAFVALKQRAAYDVDAYRVVYETEDLKTGETIEASGALFVPQADGPLPTISYQHGTIYPFEGDTKVPSNLAERTLEVALCRLLAAQGFVVAAPDYIGYGASQGRPHPYYLLESHAMTTWNLLRATAEVAGRQDIPLRGDVVLTGYSQGGSTSMALHRRMEARGDSTFRVAASVNGSGVYHLPEFMASVLSTEDLGVAQSDAGEQILNVYLWVIDTYLDHYEDLDRSWADVVVSPYAAPLDTARSVFDVAVPPTPKTVFTSDFRSGIQTRRDSALVRVLEENSNYQWSPQAPVYMVHGTGDNIVPFANARVAMQNMRERGVDTATLIPVEGAGHGDTFSRYLEVLVGTLEEMASANLEEEGNTTSTATADPTSSSSDARP
ncbi:MAG: alpha/beta fold hydrolase [Bacteroidetes bacterium]|jgi:pimeloyl-ACP methyl ester carboxylesterase|nr:alpha/beta fold hydrolase [Bacteroidota bacterium]